jgi:hypothetical protein
MFLLSGSRRPPGGGLSLVPKLHLGTYLLAKLCFAILTERRKKAEEKDAMVMVKVP